MKAHRTEYQAVNFRCVQIVHTVAYDLGEACVNYFLRSGRALNLVDNVLVGEVNYYLIRGEAERCDCYPHIYEKRLL